ncbi:MAG: glycosyltransferase [Methylotetracoccus sp.]|nr:glycosyltransferase [Methylotetracoccus sp.]
MRTLKIGVISTEGVGRGGAVRATRRLVAGLNARGHEAKLISLEQRRAIGGVGVIPSPPRSPDQSLALGANDSLQQAYIGPRRTPVSNTFFSAQVAGYSFADQNLLGRFDILNLHWVANFLAPHTLADIIRLGRPVIHTLHDMGALTGGCHYSAGCDRYRAQCSPCPQLHDDLLELPRWTLAQKRELLRGVHYTAVAPSRWLAGCAQDSGLFGADRVFQIPNGLETDLFRPTEKSSAKTLLGIDPSVKTLLLGAENHREQRKGFDLLLEAWKALAQEPRIAGLVNREQIRLLAFGKETDALADAGVPLLNLGTVQNDSRLALIYSAADLLILPSREDNLPNILVEAMACGTPVVAFAIGGIPDVIDDRIDGRLITPFSTREMAQAVLELLIQQQTAAAMASAARRKMAERYSLDVQAAAYEHLFSQMLAEHQAAAAPRSEPRADTVPDTITLPVTLNPNARQHPLHLFLEQYAQTKHWRERHAEAACEIDQVNDVLSTAIREVLSSRSWRWTRRLRGIQRDPQITGGSTPTELAVVLLTLFRSKSWEFMAPLRVLSRVIDSAARLSMRFRRRPADTPALIIDSLPPSTFAVEISRQSQRERTSAKTQDLNVICLHLFHLDLWEEFRTALKPLIGPGTPLYVTLPESNAHFIPNLHREFGPQHCKVFVLENRGLDIYPFLFIFDQLSTQGIKPLTLTKLHTKKSAHHSPESAASWRKELYQGLVTHHALLTRLFHDKSLAMVCSKKWWVHEDETSENFQAEQRAIEAACRLFGVSRTDHYLSGSMYIVSFDYLEALFTGVERDALLSQLQPGYQRSGTLAHGFERVICYGVEKFALKVGLL